jgi:hypothetical protein
MQATSTLTASHIAHLTSEGFTPDQIEQLQRLGVRSLTAAEAVTLNLKIWERRGKSLAIVRWPLLPVHDHVWSAPVRCAMVRSNGDTAKYLTPVGAPIASLEARAKLSRAHRGL